MRLKNLHKLPTLVILGVFGAMRVYVCHATFFGQRTRDRCVRAHCHGQICIRANHWPQNSDVPNMPTLKTVIAFFSSAIAHNWLEIQLYPLCLPKQKKRTSKILLVINFGLSYDVNTQSQQKNSKCIFLDWIAVVWHWNEKFSLPRSGQNVCGQFRDWHGFNKEKKQTHCGHDISTNSEKNVLEIPITTMDWVSSGWWEFSPSLLRANRLFAVHSSDAFFSPFGIMKSHADVNFNKYRGWADNYAAHVHFLVFIFRFSSSSSVHCYYSIRN